ncbi:hypothetical protein C0J52_05393 [Blattella germanica]|nr:hypothetical protein C0J52_05393 [Blattella germanica]
MTFFFPKNIRIQIYLGIDKDKDSLKESLEGHRPPTDRVGSFFQHGEPFHVRLCKLYNFGSGCSFVLLLTRCSVGIPDVSTVLYSLQVLTIDNRHVL